MALGVVTAEEATWGFGPTKVAGLQLVMDEVATARWLATIDMEANHRSWSAQRAVGLYELTARTITTRLGLGAMTRADIWTSDRDNSVPMRACKSSE